MHLHFADLRLRETLRQSITLGGTMAMGETSGRKRKPRTVSSKRAKPGGGVRSRRKAADGSQGAAADAPFLLAAPADAATQALIATPVLSSPAFPADVTVAPHRGAVIASHGALPEPKRSKARAKPAKSRAAKARARKPASAMLPAAPAPQPPVVLPPIALPLPPRAEPLAHPQPSVQRAEAEHVPLSQRHWPTRPLPPARALVRADDGPIARLVAWLQGLGRFLPRKRRRAALPRPRQVLPQPQARRRDLPETKGGPADELTRLRAENERLRRELALLAREQPANAS